MSNDFSIPDSLGLFKVVAITQEDMILYFAYGSNMSTPRLRERIPAAQPVGSAVLQDYEFKCNKKSKDGSSKGNISPQIDALTWGVVYKVPDAELPILDETEGGYKRITVSVSIGGQQTKCETYISEKLSTELPYDWYMKYIIDGARENGLPNDYVMALSQYPVKEDKRKRQ